MKKKVKRGKLEKNEKVHKNKREKKKEECIVDYYCNPQ